MTRCWLNTWNAVRLVHGSSDILASQDVTTCAVECVFILPDVSFKY